MATVGAMFAGYWAILVGIIIRSPCPPRVSSLNNDDFPSKNDDLSLKGSGVPLKMISCTLTMMSFGR